MKLTVNGVPRDVDLEPETPLLWVLRDELGLKGTKFGCGLAQCGACSVLIDGKVQRACVTPLETVDGAIVTTIEGASSDPVGERVTAAWVAHQAPQCGYCQSGQVMAAIDLLKTNPAPTDADIDAAMTNLCRCGTYNAIRAAIHAAAAGDPT